MIAIEVLGTVVELDPIDAFLISMSLAASLTVTTCLGLAEWVHAREMRAIRRSLGRP